MEEIWNPVVNFDGYYEVSNLGRVRSLDRVCNCIRNGEPATRRVKGRIRKLPLNSFGYPTITLTVKGERTCVHVHVIVLEAFICKRPANMEACHGDGVKSNCRLDNLRWDTRKNNHKDKKLHGTYQQGESASHHKLTEKSVIYIRSSGDSLKSLAKRYHVSLGCVGKAKYKDTWKHVEV